MFLLVRTFAKYKAVPLTVGLRTACQAGKDDFSIIEEEIKEDASL